jgi:hypothetical protein
MAMALVSAGCVRRQLTIRSEPAGAEVVVNDKVVGVTPHSYDFMWYGSYRITLRKPGYEQLDERVLLKCPPYLWIPFDLVMEMIPVTIRDRQELSYQLRRQTPLPEPTPPPLEEPPKSEGET